MKTAIFASIFAILFSTVTFAQTGQFPTLSGASAVDQLKRSGSYRSLEEAVAATRRVTNRNTAVTKTKPFGESIKLTAPGGNADDWFGYSVAISGRTAVVGNVFKDQTVANQGAVFVYVQVGTRWISQAVLVADDPGASDAFGSSVAIDGDTIVAGAYVDDIGANTNQGSAYVFTRSGNTWTQQAKLVAADGAAGDFFGQAVAIQNNTVAVTSHFHTVGANTRQGAAYIFTRDGSVWSQRTQLTASDGSANDWFGNSIGISKNTVVVGARSDSVGGNPSQGSAYVFVGEGSDWAEQAHLTASDGAANDSFGYSVAVSGDTAVVGSYQYDRSGDLDQGTAYIFVRNGSVWAQQAQLFSSDGAAYDQFGASVAISGDVAVIGANRDDRGRGDEGSAYVFVRSGSAWAQRSKLESSDPGQGDEFGSSVATNGGTVIIGAFRNDFNSVNQGSAYIFHEMKGNWLDESEVSHSNGDNFDTFGNSVSISGDTAVVGSKYKDIGGNTDVGAAYVFVRNGNIWQQQAELVAADGVDLDNFGYSVSISGDVIIVGAPYDDVGTNRDQGSAYVFTRNGTTWSQQTQLVAADGAPDDYFGNSVATNGYFAVIGAAYDTVGTNNDQGSAYVFINYTTSWAQEAQIVADDGAIGDLFGWSVAISGDTVIVGAPWDNIGANTDQGSAYAFNRVGGPAWPQQAKFTDPGGHVQDLFGYSVGLSSETAIIGCVNGDVGLEPDHGSAFIFERSGTNWSQQAFLSAADISTAYNFGFSVGISGDTAVVGSNLDTMGDEQMQGSVYVFMRDGTAWTQRRRLEPLAAAAGDWLGSSVAISGDKIISGSPNAVMALSDQVIGGRTAQPSTVYRGSAYIFVNTPFTPFDYDGDSRADVSVYRPSNGIWYIDRSQAGGFAIQFGNSTDKIAPADYDGDGKTDVAVYRGSAGTWYMYNSATLTYTTTVFGIAGDIPAPGDYDGDGQADLALYRPSTGTWWLNRSTDGLVAIQFGISGDVPVPGDFDGDGRSDLVVYRPSNGIWYMDRSATGGYAVQFGNATDKIVPADYDGDGKMDVGIYRPSQGTWYGFMSRDGSYPVMVFGLASDMPTPGDYDGDGQADIAIYRPSNGQWWIDRSSSGLTVFQYGLDGDEPTQCAFGN